MTQHDNTVSRDQVPLIRSSSQNIRPGALQKKFDGWGEARNQASAITDSLRQTPNGPPDSVAMSAPRASGLRSAPGNMVPGSLQAKFDAMRGGKPVDTASFTRGSGLAKLDRVPGADGVTTPAPGSSEVAGVDVAHGQAGPGGWRLGRNKDGSPFSYRRTGERSPESFGNTTGSSDFAGPSDFDWADTPGGSFGNTTGSSDFAGPSDFDWADTPGGSFGEESTTDRAAALNKIGMGNQGLYKALIPPAAEESRAMRSYETLMSLLIDLTPEGRSLRGAYPTKPDKPALLFK